MCYRPLAIGNQRLAMKNILITGRPGVGKTTLILKVTRLLTTNAAGFYTREVRIRGRRVGFELCTFDGKKALLAHVDFRSRFRVGKYGVDLQPLEDLGVSAIEMGIQKGCFIVVDEIGRMELYSAAFRDVVIAALDADVGLLATVGPQPIPFLQKIKSRTDCEVLEVTTENRDATAADIVSRLSAI